MSNSELTMQKVNASRVTWTEDEWYKIASELKRRHPKNSFANYHNLSITISDFEDAMESVIHQERQKSFSEFTELRRPLFDSFSRISQSTSQKPKLSIVEGHVDGNGYIKWSVDEWEVVVLEFDRIYPGQLDKNLSSLKISQIRDAVEILPMHRRRYFAQLDLFRRQALRTWEHLPKDVKNNGIAKRIIVDFPSGPIMQPPVKPSDKQSAIATAIHEAFLKSDDNKESKKRIVWTEEEWISVAKEMHRQNPHAGFFTSNFFDIDIESILSAQREALPFDRRRKYFQASRIRLSLVEAFRALKANDALKVKIEEPIIQPQPEPEIVQDAFIQNSVTQETTVQNTIVTSEKEELDFLAKVLNAAAPLLNLLVNEVAQRITPSIINALMPAIENAMRDLQRPLETIEVRQPTTLLPDVLITPASVLPRPVMEKVIIPEKPKKQVISVLGPFGQQKNELEKSFPQYDFLFIENGRGFKEAGTRCVLFIAAIPYCNKANKDSIKAHISAEKVRYVDGGVSMIKRQIDIWEANHKG